MRRDTSNKAWKEFSQSNSKAVCMKKVVKTLAKNGPLTGQEICKKAKTDGLWKRLSELETMGYVQTKGKRACRVTGRTSYVWTLAKSS